MATKQTGVQKVSTAKGNSKKGGQTYQNFFGFKHNGKSVKTAKILVTPLDRLCQRCYDCIQWKIDYRKYKPLTKAHKCNKCHEPKIIKAYRNVCDGCAAKDKNNGCKICTKCGYSVVGNYATARVTSKADEARIEERKKDFEDALSSLKLRCRRVVERKLEKGEITYHHAKKAFVYVEDNDKEFAVKKIGDEEYGDEMFSSDEDEEKHPDLDNVDQELDAIDNEDIETKIAEVTKHDLEENKAQMDESGVEIAGGKIPMCHKQHVLKAKMCLPDCYIGKFDGDQNFLYCDSCQAPMDFLNVWFHHCKTCQSDFCQRCKGQIIKTEADADHQNSDGEDSQDEQIEEQKN